jgi:cytochrome oxidase assembly protein ShyY1
MRILILPYAAWMGLLSLATSNVAGDLPRVAAMASVLATLTVLIYRLGVWRQERENTKHNVSAEVRGFLDRSALNLDRIELQMVRLDRMIKDFMEFKRITEQCQEDVEERLQRLEEP